MLIIKSMHVISFQSWTYLRNGGSIAASQRRFETCLQGIMLKPEQSKAIELLLNGNDVFAVLPTGFGKSLIYHSFVFAKKIINGHSPTIIVIIPLRSIIQEQLKCNEFCLKALELTLNKKLLAT